LSRLSRVLGVAVWLSVWKGKAIYLGLFPHTWSHLVSNEVPDNLTAATAPELQPSTLSRPGQGLFFGLDFKTVNQELEDNQ